MSVKDIQEKLKEVVDVTKAKHLAGFIVKNADTFDLNIPHPLNTNYLPEIFTDFEIISEEFTITGCLSIDKNGVWNVDYYNGEDMDTIKDVYGDIYVKTLGINHLNRFHIGMYISKDPNRNIDKFLTYLFFEYEGIFCKM